jgi:thioredoxin 1
MLQPSTWIGGLIGVGIVLLVAVIRRRGSGKDIFIAVMFATVIGAVVGMQVGQRGGLDALESLPTITTLEELNTHVTSDTPVMVMVYTTWCRYCHKLAPTIGELAVEYEGRVSVITTDYDRADVALQQELSPDEGFPTVLIYAKGQQSFKLAGARDGDVYRKILDQMLTNETSSGTTPDEGD